MAYKSKYNSYAYDLLFTLVDNNLLIKEALFLEDITPYTKISKFIADNLNLDLSARKAVKVNGNTNLYKHTIRSNNRTFLFITHYPNKYASLFDAVYDFGDQIKQSYNSNRVIAMNIQSGIIKITYIDGSNIMSINITMADTIQEYIVSEIEVI